MVSCSLALIPPTCLRSSLWRSADGMGMAAEERERSRCTGRRQAGVRVEGEEEEEEEWRGRDSGGEDSACMRQE